MCGIVLLLCSCFNILAVCTLQGLPTGFIDMALACWNGLVRIELCTMHI